MNRAFRSGPRAPVGSLVLIALMYLPWLLYFFRPRSAPGESEFEFPGGFIVLLFGLLYLVAAIALPIRLCGRRDLSHAHSIAFYASVGILVLLSLLIWTTT